MLSILFWLLRFTVTFQLGGSAALHLRCWLFFSQSTIQPVYPTKVFLYSVAYLNVCYVFSNVNTTYFRVFWSLKPALRASGRGGAEGRARTSGAREPRERDLERRCAYGLLAMHTLSRKTD